jgi:hypothetical protein
VPQWVVLLALAIAAWLLVAVGGGLLLGRAIDRLYRFVRRPGRRRPA